MLSNRLSSYELYQKQFHKMREEELAYYTSPDFMQLVQKHTNASEGEIEQLVQDFCGPWYSKHQYAWEKQICNIDSYISTRDEDVLCCIYEAQQISSHDSYNLTSDSFLSKKSIYSDLEDLSRKLDRRPGKLKYVTKKSLGDGKYHYFTSSFCHYSNLLLEFKHSLPRPNATEKKYGLAWLGSAGPNLSSLQRKFQIADFWYYEQHTGVNLCVEVAAHIDSLFAKYGHHLGFESLETAIFDMLVLCLEKNYHFLAWIPAIDCKISAVKHACSEVVKLYFIAFSGNQGDDRLGRIVSAAIQQKKDEFSCAAREIYSSVYQIAIPHFFSEILWQHILDIPTDIHQPLHKVVEDCLALVRRREWTPIKNTNHNATIYTPDLPRYTEGRKINELISTEKLAVSIYQNSENPSVDGDGKAASEQSEPTITSDTRQQVIRLYTEKSQVPIEQAQSSGSLLVFCNPEDKRIQKYIDEARFRKGLSPKQRERFCKLQAAVITALFHMNEPLE